MDLRRFRRLVDAYGGDLSRWPRADRDEADALATASPELRQLLEEAAKLDSALQAMHGASDVSERLRGLIERAARSVALETTQKRGGKG